MTGDNSPDSTNIKKIMNIWEILCQYIDNLDEVEKILEIYKFQDKINIMTIPISCK